MPKTRPPREDHRRMDRIDVVPDLPLRWVRWTSRNSRTGVERTGVIVRDREVLDSEEWRQPQVGAAP
jgi:hypothetical protein